MASKRPSMKGMGADAFFETPVSQPTGKPVSQETSKMGNQQDVTPTGQLTGLPANQHTDKPVSQQTGLSVDQEDSKPIEQQDVIAANQETSIAPSQLTSRPASQQADKPEDVLIKATFYLTQDHIMQLERIRLERKLKGIKVDKSALVREAIDLLKE